MDARRLEPGPGSLLRPAPGTVRNPTPWLAALGLVVASRAVYLVVAYLASAFLSGTRGSSAVGLLDAWVHWDARHFVQVAVHGYTGEGTDPHATAFFPLFPLTIRALAATGMAPGLAGMVVSFAATWVAVAHLWRLAEGDLGPGAGRRAALYLLFFPTAVFLVAPYSEALFLAGAIPAFAYARRGRWGPAALGAAVAVGARAAGVFVVAGLACEALRRRERGRRLATAAATLGASLLPVAAYAAFLARAVGDPLHFFVDQRRGWGREPTWPWESVARTLEAAGVPAGEGSLTNFVIGWRIEVVAAAVGLGFVVWALIRREWGYAVFMGLLLGAVVSSGVLLSVPRMLLSMFPAVLLLASWARTPARHEALLVSFVALATLGTVVFVRHAWFF